MNKLEELNTGYYLALKEGTRPGVCEYVKDEAMSAHWRNFQDDRVNIDPRSLGYRLLEIKSLQGGFK